MSDTKITTPEGSDPHSMKHVTFFFADGGEFTTQVPAGRMEVVTHVYRNDAGEIVGEPKSMFLPWTPAELVDMACGALPMEHSPIRKIGFNC